MVNQRLMMGRMSSQLRQVLITATAAVPASDPNQRAIGAIYLAAISSEYTVYGGGFSAGGVIPDQRAAADRAHRGWRSAAT